jgi:hypothetical protein
MLLFSAYSPKSLTLNISIITLIDELLMISLYNPSEFQTSPNLKINP